MNSDYEYCGIRLADFLRKKLAPENGYPEAPTYGYAFTNLLSSQLPESDLRDELYSKSLRFLLSQEKSSKNYSWEFVTYAVARSHENLPNNKLRQLNQYRAKGTRVFNWYLLRVWNQVYHRRFSHLNQLYFRTLTRLFSNRKGLIKDEIGTRSLQYHSFSTFLLIQILNIHPQATWLNHYIERAITYSSKMILDDGTALYVGRGQEQIFGYGALIYNLRWSEINHPKDNTLKAKREKITERLLSFQRDDGSFPLVLRRRDPEPANATFHKDNPHGWFGYNTLYDYLPFLGVMLLETHHLEQCRR